MRLKIASDTYGPIKYYHDRLYSPQQHDMKCHKLDHWLLLYKYYVTSNI